MSHWKLTLSYDGTPYHGWQVQPGLPTVQGTLAEAIAELTGEQVLPQGSGRTDAGVHALGQVASFSLRAPIPEANLQRALNRILPPSIRVQRAEEAAEDFHARASARRKSYEYRVFERRRRGPDGKAAERICSPFLAPFVWDCRWPLDITAMQEAAAAFVGRHDFMSFGASDPELTRRREAEEGEEPGGPNPVKTMFSSRVDREGDLLTYRVTGSGFLHHMVRNMVGTLVEVGRGSIRADAMEGILAARDRGHAGPTAPATGLFLVSVDYGDPA